MSDFSPCPALHYTREDGRQTLVQVSGAYVGMQERVTSREYDPSGTLRYERIEERAWTAPVSSVPADRLVRQVQYAVEAGQETSLLRALAQLALTERSALPGRDRATTTAHHPEVPA